MTPAQWSSFAHFRNAYRSCCDEWEKTADSPAGWLTQLQTTACASDGTPEYPLETAVVYNRNLDDISEHDRIDLILVADNPGKDEQLAKNRRYLVGQSGKLADRFFRMNPELNIDFRKNVVILNKSPIHTAKTKQLGLLRKNGGERFRAFFEETQRRTAEETVKLQRGLGCPLWIVGYAEMRTSGLFAPYSQELQVLYDQKPESPVFLYQHFSMNRFTIDLEAHRKNSEACSLRDALEALGKKRRREILGW